MANLDSVLILLLDWTPRQPTTNQLQDFPVQTISYDNAHGILR